MPVGGAGLQRSALPQGVRLQRALSLGQAVDTARVSAEALARGLKEPAIGEAIDHAREAALAALDD